MTEKKRGIVLGYVLIVANAISGILLTSILLKYLGQEEYGLYKLAASYISLISVLDFGLGGTITRYIIKYQTENEEKLEKEFLSTVFILYTILAIIVLAVGIVAGIVIPTTINGFSTSQIGMFRIIMSFLSVKTSIMLYNHAYSGWFIAYERFSYVKFSTLLQVVVKIVLVVLILPFVRSPIIVVAIDLLVTMLQLLANVYMKNNYGMGRVSFKKWNGTLFKELTIFTSAIFIASVINQFNSNIDNIVLGTYKSTIYVGLYAAIMQIYTVYASMSTAIQDVFLPQISKTVFHNRSNNEITIGVVRPSRMQFIVLMLALTGFLLYGHDFLKIWIGKGYNSTMITEAYWVGIIILVSSTWQLCQNSVTAVLKAKNLLRGKVILTGLSTLVNFVLTIIWVPQYGMLGAAVATAISMIFGYGIATNIYYKRVVGLNLKLYYKLLLSKTWYAIGLMCCIGLLIRRIPIEGILGFGIKILIYVLLYALILYMLGLQNEEKEKIKTDMLGILAKK